VSDLPHTDLPLTCGPLVSYFPGGPLCRVVWATATQVELLWTSPSGYDCRVVVSRAALEQRA
jgi:hypothetical protein